MNATSRVWQEKVRECRDEYEYVSTPRGMEVREITSGQYDVPMPAYIDLRARKVNVNFMFAEAAWIISGSNRLEDIYPYMKTYGNFSDDGVFLRGAYGPKVVDQFPYIVDTLLNDIDSRQAVINIWRERPSSSKDIPCTTSMQFIIRDSRLNMIVTMRSNDIVLGFTYDVFTFSMVAESVRLLLKERGLDVLIGELTVTAGSLHIYERHYEQANEWLAATDVDEEIGIAVSKYTNAATYLDLIKQLKRGAEEYGEAA